MHNPSSASFITTPETGNPTIRNHEILFNIQQGFCRRVNNANLQPTGKLKILDRSVEYFPEEVLPKIQKKPCFQLHLWSTGRKKRGNIFSYCKNCRVILCNYLFHPFYTQPDPVCFKNWFTDIYDREDGKYV